MPSSREIMIAVTSDVTPGSPDHANYLLLPCRGLPFAHMNQRRLTFLSTGEAHGLRYAYP